MRSLDSYESTLKQFHAKLKEIKTIIGQFFMPTAQKILRFGAQGLTMLRDFVMRLSSFVSSIGGAEAVLAILSATLAGMFAIMNVGKLGAAVNTFAKLASTFGVAAAKALILFTSVLLVVLLIQDFISFMQGKDSLIGVMLEKSGVDCDALRDKVRDTWNNIKSVFEIASGIIRNTVGKLFSAIRGFWNEYGDDISSKVASTVTSVVDKLNQFSKWLADNRETVARVAGVIMRLIAVLLIAKGTIGKVVDTAKKISDIAKVAGPVVKGLGSAFKALINPAGIAIVVVAAIAAALYDLFNFMNGKDSVIGGIFEKLGIDSEKARAKLTASWETIKSFLLSVWETIKSVAMSIWDGLQTFWANHGEQIKGTLVNTWTIIRNLLTAAWNIIKTVAIAVFGALRAFWNTWGSTIIACFSGVWGIIKSVFSTVLNVLTDLFAVFASLFAGDWSGLWQNIKQLLSDVWNGILSIVGSVLSAIWGIVSSIFSSIWSFISGIAQNIWNAISTTFTNILTTVSTIVGNILTAVTTTFSNIRTSIAETVAGIRDSIVSGFQAAIDWITSLPAQAFQWGADIINSIINGIKSVVGGVGEAVSGVASTIRSFLHFSEPDEGPLSDFHTYMPDMIDLMTKGIRTGRPRVKKAIGDLAGDMSTPIQSTGAPESGSEKTPKLSANGKSDSRSTLGTVFSALKEFAGYAGSIAKSAGGLIANNKSSILETAGSLMNNASALSRSATPSPSAIRTATTNNSTSNRTINFKSEIKQEFNGDMAAQQNIARAADSAADDTTGVLARALSYA